jgi:hypothetical protein
MQNKDNLITNTAVAVAKPKTVKKYSVKQIMAQLENADSALEFLHEHYKKNIAPKIPPQND